MAYTVPDSLSPSRVDAFTSCPLAFRFASIEKLPEPPSPHAVKGTLVHQALERLLARPDRDTRTLPAALDDLHDAVSELRGTEEWARLDLGADEEADFLADADQLVRNYFELEDPRTVDPLGLELRMHVTVGELTLRGIIDRLELEDGELVVTDYKTGKPPARQYEQGRLGGLNFYAYLCEHGTAEDAEVAGLGRRPVRIQLYYLRTKEVISQRPTEQSIAYLPKRTLAVHRAIAKACDTGDFRPNQSRLCDFCSFKPWCPAFGGDPAKAAQEAPVAFGYQPA